MSKVADRSSVVSGMVTDAAVGNAQGGSGPFVHVSAVEKVVFQLRFADLLWGFLVEVNKLADRTGIALLGTFAHSG